MDNSDMMFETFALIVAATPVAIILITVFVKLFGFIRNLFSDAKQYEATVLKKAQSEETRGGRAGQYSIPYRVELYFITFATQKHKRLRLKVDSSTYRAVKEDDRGTLTLQGKKFISFEKHREDRTDG